MSKYLIVVDVQKDFVEGALGTPEAQAIIPRVKEKIAHYREVGGKIIFTRDTHREDYLATNEGKHLPVAHCIKDTDGWQIYEGLAEADDVILDKPTFGFLDWKDYIADDAELSIELIGLCTDICVASNALILKAAFPEATVSVDPLACAGVTPASHDAALTTMRMCQVEVAEEQKVEDKKKSTVKNVIGIISNIVACILYVPLSVYFVILGLMFLVYADYSAIWSVSGIFCLIAGGIWLCTPLACVAAIIWSFKCRKKEKQLKGFLVQLLPLESVLLGIFMFVVSWLAAGA